ncbi:hypothetical protein [Candidatus Villigracilis saccharophilus]|uniref:hypothetical protein n=1 Tax=Candidatus Villigracilis saccharophilus TaxID=3140684 RepID=UPI003136BE58|nr:hypothetical protein [Anaerolineales bacterium]
MNAKKSMSNRNKKIILVGVALIATIIFIANVILNETWFSPEAIAIHIVIDNRTNKQIGPFVISEYRDSEPLQINQIEPFSKANVYYLKSKSGGENEITMTDSNGKEYPVVPYFEQDQRGRVDIRVECASAEGLSGKKREMISWYFSFEWSSWGTRDCKNTYD